MYLKRQPCYPYPYSACCHLQSNTNCGSPDVPVYTSNSKLLLWWFVLRVAVLFSIVSRLPNLVKKNTFRFVESDTNCTCILLLPDSPSRCARARTRDQFAKTPGTIPATSHNGYVCFAFCTFRMGHQVLIAVSM